MTSKNKLSTIGFSLALLLILGTATCRPATEPASPASTVRQGWNQAQRLSWYQASQGSRLMPWAWAKALEQAENDQPFLAEAHMKSFRFVPLAESKADPKLPIGFAIDQQDDSNLSFTKLRWYDGQPRNEQWLGLNCSACHTAQINFEGRPLTIDGGPSLVDFQRFIEAVDAALAATIENPAKWDRFARKVLADGADPVNRSGNASANRDTPANRDMLKRELARLVAWEKENARLNDTPLRYGYGRLDAFGHIFNKVSQLAVHEMPPPAARPTPNPADAPVSYPFLWDIYRQSHLQWNGIIEVKEEDGEVARLPVGGGRYLDYSALGRNTGEVIGVFGDVAIKPATSLTGYQSSINATNLDRLEAMLRRLQPPKWPGTLDQAKVDSGRALFKDKGCSSCHTIQPPGASVYDVRMVPLTRDSQGNPNRNNTDPWMACNALSYVSASGKLQNQPRGYFRGERLGRTEPVATLLTTSVVGTLVGKWQEILRTTSEIFLGVERLPRVVGARDTVSPEEKRQGRLEQCFAAKSKLFAYKARPLDGIWATAPFLHNGSVPTLYDLLRAPADRPASFLVGTRQFDPVKVGYVTTPNAPGNSFIFNATGPANSNEGHDYNVGRLTEAERAALLEFMKTL
jgi:mono/diheme cytochrome c family protein